MAVRLKTILDEMIQRIEAINIDDDSEPQLEFLHVPGRWDIFHEQASVSDRAFSISILGGTNLPDFGLQSEAELETALEIVVCHSCRNDSAAQEKILAHDIEKIFLTLEKLSNAGSAALVKVNNFSTNRRSQFFWFTTFNVTVRYSVSFDILN